MTEPTDHATRLREMAVSRPFYTDVLNAAADELDRLRVEVERLTPPPPKPSVFARELATYAANKPTWIEGGHEGHYVVIRGDDVLGPGPCSYEDALRTGYRHFGLEGFMVKQVLAVEPVLVMLMRPTTVHPEG